VAVAQARGKRIGRAAILCLFLALGAYAALNAGYFNKPPWAAGVAGDSFSYAAQGFGGECYAIDSGEARLICFGEDGAFRWDAAPGGALRLVAPSPSGGAWVTAYDFNDSERIVRADILEYTRSGRLARTLLSQSYGDGSEGSPLPRQLEQPELPRQPEQPDSPEQAGLPGQPELPLYTSGYLGLVAHGQWLYYIEKHPDDLALYRLDTAQAAPAPEAVAVFPYPGAEALTLAAACDPESGAVYAADKFGVLRELSRDGAHRELPYPGSDAAELSGAAAVLDGNATGASSNATGASGNASSSASSNATGASGNAADVGAAGASDGGGADFYLPYGLCVSEGVLLVSDIGKRRLYAMRGGAFELAADLGGGGAGFAQDPRLYYWISAAPGGQALLASRYDLLRCDLLRSAPGGASGGATEAMPAFFFFGGAKRLSIWLWWLSAAALAAGALALLCRIFMRAYRALGIERLASSLMLAAAVAVVAALVAAQYSSTFSSRFSRDTIDNLAALSALTAASVDGEALSRIGALGDYGGEDYAELRRQLAPMSGSGDLGMIYEDGGFQPVSADWDRGVYRMLIRVINGRVYYVYSSADQWGALYPMDYPYEGTEFQIAYEQKAQIVFPDVVDYTGEYAYTVTPILDAGGAVAGALEMGVDLRAFRREMSELLLEIALRALLAVFVVLLLLKELIFAAGELKSRGRGGEKRLIGAGAVRPLMFLLYLLDCFALVISPLFARSLYAERLGVPMEVGVAIAYSATFFFFGLAAVAGGRVGRRAGLFPLLVAGASLLFFGELLSMLSGSLWMFAAAKSVVGVGAGLTQNCADAIAAAREDSREVEYGFSMSYAGYSSGTNCGLAIGTGIALAWGYRAVFLASALAALVLLAYVLFMCGGGALPDATERGGGRGRDSGRGRGRERGRNRGRGRGQEWGRGWDWSRGRDWGLGRIRNRARGMLPGQSRSMSPCPEAGAAGAAAPDGAAAPNSSRAAPAPGFARFIVSPGVLAFFLLVVAPYMLCNGFAYYFLPLAGSARGLGEENISRVVFAYGMVSVYVGPPLTAKLTGMFRAGTVLLMGCGMIALALALYAAAPALPALLAATAVFALADSFSFTAQNVYFSQLPATRAYGAGAALGVSNVVGGLAQSMSSYCFAAAMVLGERAGMWAMGIGMAAALLLFALASAAGRGRRREALG
jgi:predicted MFS family arabinose efflux permease